MKIDYGNKVRFKELWDGDCFRFNDMVFMKLATAVLPFNGSAPLNVVNLEDGELAYLLDDDLVSRFDATLTVS